MAPSLTKSDLKKYQKKYGLTRAHYAKKLAIQDQRLGRIYKGDTKRIPIEVIERATEIETEWNRKTSEQKMPEESISLTPNEKLFIRNLRELPENKRREIWTFISNVFSTSNYPF